jgi:hypothetical protein
VSPVLDGGAESGAAAPDAPAGYDSGDSGAPGGLYAAPAGGGTTCTLEAPCTLERAAAAVRAHNQALTTDLVVTLRGGTYRLAGTFALRLPDSGSGGHQVVYRAYAGEVPILSGAVRVTGFAMYDTGRSIWRAALPAGTRGRQLFVNGARAQRARGVPALRPMSCRRVPASRRRTARTPSAAPAAPMSAPASAGAAFQEPVIDEQPPPAKEKLNATSPMPRHHGNPDDRNSIDVTSRPTLPCADYGTTCKRHSCEGLPLGASTTIASP